eukprot:7391100-Prymnesium_polylepis.2
MSIIPSSSKSVATIARAASADACVARRIIGPGNAHDDVEQTIIVHIGKRDGGSVLTYETD